MYKATWSRLAVTCTFNANPTTNPKRSADAMSGVGAGAGGAAELGSGAEHKEDVPGQEGGAHGRMELGALRAFMETDLHTVSYTHLTLPTICSV